MVGVSLALHLALNDVSPRMPSSLAYDYTIYIEVEEAEKVFQDYNYDTRLAV